jgi:hypothetical protein
MHLACLNINMLVVSQPADCWPHYKVLWMAMTGGGQCKLDKFPLPPPVGDME